MTDMGDQEEAMALDQAKETNGPVEIEKKTGGRKWFKRSVSAGKRKSTESGMKPRSRSVFAFLCKLGKKKDKKQPKLDKVDADQDEPRETGDATPMTNQPFPNTESCDEESEGLSKLEMEFKQCMEDIEHGWIDFGKSMGASANAGVVSTKVQMEKICPKPVAEEDDPEIKALVEKAPSLALGSVHHDFEWPSIPPLGVPGNTSNCDPLAFMTLDGSMKEPKEAGLVSAASVKDANALTSYESEQSCEAANAAEKTCDCCAASSFSSTMGPDLITFSPTAPVQNIVVTPNDPSNTVLISDVGEESVTMEEECVQEGTSKQFCKLKSAVEGESKTAVPEESKC